MLNYWKDRMFSIKHSTITKKMITIWDIQIKVDHLQSLKWKPNKINDFSDDRDVLLHLRLF